MTTPAGCTCHHQQQEATGSQCLLLPRPRHAAGAPAATLFPCPRLFPPPLPPMHAPGTTTTWQMGCRRRRRRHRCCIRPHPFAPLAAARRVRRSRQWTARRAGARSYSDSAASGTAMRRRRRRQLGSRRRASSRLRRRTLAGRHRQMLHPDGVSSPSRKLTLTTTGWQTGGVESMVAPIAVNPVILRHSQSKSTSAAAAMAAAGEEGALTVTELPQHPFP